MTFPAWTKWTILVSALLGTLMSGYLSYNRYILKACSNSIISCGVNGKVVTIFGIATCAYGFVFFLASLILMVLAWKKQDAMSLAKALVVIGIAGTLFSVSLSYYEVITLEALKYGSPPACVYGLVFFLGILVGSIGAWRAKPKLPMVIPPQVS